MALNDSCHLLIETKHHFIQKSGGGGLSPLASAATATMERQSEVSDLTNGGVIYNEIERHVIQISRSHHYLTLNISETVRDRDTVIMEGLTCGLLDFERP